MGQLAVIERRKDLILQVEQADLNIQSHKIEVVKKSAALKVGSMDAEDYTGKIKVLLDFVYKDLGLNGIPESYDVARLCSYLLTWFSDFSVGEVKMAFECYMSQELAPYLKRNAEHYGKWSLEFCSKILAAYRVYRGKTIQEVKGLLPSPEDIPKTPEQKEEIRRDWRNHIKRLIIEALEEKKELPRFYYTSSAVHSTLCKVGLLSPCEVSEESIELRLLEITRNPKIAKPDKNRIRDKYEVGKIDRVLEAACIGVKTREEIEKLLSTTTIEKVEEAFNNYENNK